MEKRKELPVRCVKGESNVALIEVEKTDDGEKRIFWLKMSFRIMWLS